MVLKCFARVCTKVYITIVSEHIPPGFRSYIFVLRVTGIWPIATDTSYYKWLTIVLIIFIGILFPLSLFINVFHATSIHSAMSHFFLSLTVGLTALKLGIIYWRRSSIRDLFRIHFGLLHDGENYDMIARINFLVHIIISVLYVLCCTFVNAQSVMAKPGGGLFPSTGNLPYAFAQHRTVYLSVLGYQIWSSIGIVFWTAMEDAFYIALMNTACGHVDVLKERLRKLGSKHSLKIDRDTRFYADLIDCCKKYGSCLR